MRQHPDIKYIRKQLCHTLQSKNIQLCHKLQSKNIHKSIFSLKSAEKKRIFSLGRKKSVLQCGTAILMYIDLRCFFLLNVSESHFYQKYGGKRGMKKPVRAQKTYTIRELNDAFNALVKPECQDMPFPMVWARRECLNIAVKEKMAKINQ